MEKAVLDILRVFIVVIILSFLSIQDIKYRRINTNYSVLLLFTGSVFLLFDIYYNNFYIVSFDILGNLIMIVPILLILNFFGFGMGDVKVILSLCIIIPSQPDIILFPLSEILYVEFPYNSMNSPILYILFYSSIVASIFNPFYIFIINLKENCSNKKFELKRIYTIKTKNISKYHGEVNGIDTKFFKDISEYYRKDLKNLTKQDLAYFLSQENEWGTKNIDNSYSRFKQTIEQEEYEINYYIPYIVYILIGFILMVIFGNPLLIM